VESSNVVRRPVGTEEGLRAIGWGSLPQELLRDAQDQLHAISHAQFLVQALAVRVHGVRRDAEIDGDREFGLVIEYAPHNFSFTMGEPQAASNLIPGLVGKDRRTWTAREFVLGQDKGGATRRSPPANECRGSPVNRRA
jgi:hypothetical protein